MATTSKADAEAIVNAADAWLLKNLTTGENAFSYTTPTGQTMTVNGYESVTKLRDYYQRVLRGLEGRRRTFARFDG